MSSKTTPMVSNSATVLSAARVSGNLIEGQSLRDSGAIKFTDANAKDVVTASSALKSLSWLGSNAAMPPAFTAAQQSAFAAALSLKTDYAKNTKASGQIDWSFNMKESQVDFLAKGESVKVVYTISVSDGKGGLTTQDVTITLTGANDSVRIVHGEDREGSRHDDHDHHHDHRVRKLVEDVGPQTASGVIRFADADASDRHTVSSQLAKAELEREGDRDGDDDHDDHEHHHHDSHQSLTPAELTIILAAFKATITGSGQITWTFDASNLDFLAQGEELELTFKVKVSDGTSSDYESVRIKVCGTNDAPVITGGNTGTVTEDAFPVDADSITVSGQLTSTDVDHGATAVYSLPGMTSTMSLESGGPLPGQGTYGVLSLNADGSWTYTLSNDSDVVQALGEGEEQFDTFTVIVTDEFGATDTETITIKVIGDNDAPTIDVVPQSTGPDGGFYDQMVDEPSAESPVSTVSGQLSATERDNGDSLTWSGDGEGDYGAFSISEDGEWTFTVSADKTNHLAVGEFVYDSFEFTVTDEFGATATATVTVLINGTNDGVTLVEEGTTADGVVVEDASPLARSIASQSASGSIAFNDLDLTDTHTATFVPATGQTALGTFELDESVDEAADTEGGTVGWTYTLDNDAAQYLAADESVSESFTVTVADAFGGSVTQTVTVVIRGTNDDVTIATADTTATGAVVEDAASTASETDSGVATGTVAFSDVDLTDTHTAAFEAATGQTALGTFALGAVSELAATEGGTVGWTYTLNNAAAQYLAADESVSESYTVTVTDEAGATATQTVTVTIRGTNDGPTLVTSGTIATGTVKEDGNVVAHDDERDDEHEDEHDEEDDHEAGRDHGTQERETSEPGLTATGTIAFNDVDLTDTHTAGFEAAAGQTTLGTFALGTVSESATTEGGSVGWTYTLNNSAAQYLAADESVSESFTVTITDEAGATVSQTVTVTIRGTNDGPTIVRDDTDASGSVTEDAVVQAVVRESDEDRDGREVSGEHDSDEHDDDEHDGDEHESDHASPATGQTASGTIAFNDVDLTDTHTASFRAADNRTDLGTFALGAVSESATTEGGTVGWTYTLDNEAAQYLAAGQSVSESFVVTVRDEAGATVTQTVTVTIFGTNDAPTLSTSASGYVKAGEVTERADGAANENAAPNLSATGKIAFADVDTRDTHSVSASANGTGYLGTFTPTLDAASKSVSWSYAVADSAVDHLAAGESLVQSYTVTIKDSSDATVTETVTITIQGSNDAPTLSTAASGYDKSGAVAELANNAPGEGTATLSDSGKIVFVDVDTRDTHSVTSMANGSSYYGSFAATLDQATKTVNWTFSVNDGAINGLAAGQTVIQTYTVSIKDSSNATVTETVSVTITGAADNTAPSDLVVDAMVTDTSIRSAGSELGSYGASDVDGDALSYSISGGQASMFTINRNNGDLSVARGNEHDDEDENGASLDAGTVYTFNVNVSDGTDTTSQAAVVYVGSNSGSDSKADNLSVTGDKLTLAYLLNGDDRASGGSGRDYIDGGSGDDLIKGNDGRDKLLGGSGNDTLVGGTGNDTLTGGSGADLIRGGVGADAHDLGNDSQTDVVVLVGAISATQAAGYASRFTNDPVNVSYGSGASRQTFDLSAVLSRSELTSATTTTDYDGANNKDTFTGVGSEDVLVIFGNVGTLTLGSNSYNASNTYGGLASAAASSGGGVLGGFKKVIVNSEVAFEYGDLKSLAHAGLDIAGGQADEGQTDTVITLHNVTADENNQVDLSAFFHSGIESLVIEAAEGGVNADTVFVMAADFDGAISTRISSTDAEGQTSVSESTVAQGQVQFVSAEVATVAEAPAPEVIAETAIFTGAGFEITGVTANVLSNEAQGNATLKVLLDEAHAATQQGDFGILVFNEDGSFTYTLNQGAEAKLAAAAPGDAVEAFHYAITDGQHASADTVLTLDLSYYQQPAAV